ncbi:MAG: NAD(P)-dependent methylenetetrahydromethanopterin dehydrogenase, partial [Promethearchaeota archaeon]
MQVLELEPLKKKKLKIILVQSEFPIEWYLEPPKKEEHELFPNLKFISKGYIKFIEDLIAKYKPNFAVEEKGSRTTEEFLYDNPLIDLFKRNKISYDCVDISENALLYISSTLYKNKSIQKGIDSTIKRTLKDKQNTESRDSFLSQLIAWNEYFKEEIKEKEDEIRNNIREYWMMMGILQLAKKCDEKNLTTMFICDKNHFTRISNLAGELGINTEEINIKKVAKAVPEKNSLEELFNNSILEIMPVKIKKKDKSDKILYFFDTDEFASPFDINMAYDAGFDIVVPFNKVTKDNVTKLVQDAIFSRKPKAPTTFFVGGSNVNEGEKIAKKVLKALVPPFETPVIIDPRGSHTTAAAVVAKTIEAGTDLGLSNLMGKKVVILGTGPVGRIASIIASKLYCETVLVETWDGAGEESVKT